MTRTLSDRSSATPSLAPVDGGAVDAVRDFNRRYTRIIGVLDQHLLASPFSLTEARVLYEIAQRELPSASEIGAALNLDAGYLSRILQRFTEDELVSRTAGATDRRQQRLKLTARGRAAFGQLEAASRASIGRMLEPLSEGDRERLLAALATVTRLLDDGAPAEAAVVLRPPRPGDMGWVVERHGAVYAETYGWDSGFEALVAEIVAQYLKSFDPAREACWIAEVDGERAGSIFLVRHSDTVAKLRLLLVEPSARGRGVGRRLVQECIAFARARGYRKIMLWTQSMLTEARALYAAAGFVKIASDPHRSFGHDLVGETWELELSA
ncbi:helix-turn-helix domain-containing GNAT family N-acetyltransferase [Bradyrhizobium sp. WD16]|uniref:bifunctional helix-turn-helix transcriptional regulator/GNAT family N-acetyltransferase n=1 Tax=Bradyrhizobium sp. WD16 TaxID=1521768 RepID=UPI0020A5C703|nr:helix-turn-helix domain-containing GNAT family N-acetyltransferase [Bradyrhizobium sp. WD16]UTD25834.1 MarR family transcriptional regulator [Bradyrhizobium sp. WD16]